MKKINSNKMINLFFILIVLILQFLRIYSIIPSYQLGKYIIIAIVAYLLIMVFRNISRTRKQPSTWLDENTVARPKGILPKRLPDEDIKKRSRGNYTSKEQLLK